MGLNLKFPKLRRKYLIAEEKADLLKSTIFVKYWKMRYKFVPIKFDFEYRILKSGNTGKELKELKKLILKNKTAWNLLSDGNQDSVFNFFRSFYARSEKEAEKYMEKVFEIAQRKGWETINVSPVFSYFSTIYYQFGIEPALDLIDFLFAVAENKNWVELTHEARKKIMEKAYIYWNFQDPTKTKDYIYLVLRILDNGIDLSECNFTPLEILRRVVDSYIESVSKSKIGNFNGIREVAAELVLMDPETILEDSRLFFGLSEDAFSSLFSELAKKSSEVYDLLAEKKYGEAA